MKALTHYTFSVGASLYALSVFGTLSLYSAAAAFWLSWSVNFIVDALGHSMTGPPTRTMLTHSVFTAPLWGAAVALASVSVFSRLFAWNPPLAELEFWGAAGSLVAMGHLFLDSMTQAGVYYWRNRIAIAHMRYDNPVLNAAFILAGLALVTMTVLQVNLLPHGGPIALSQLAGFSFSG